MFLHTGLWSQQKQINFKDFPIPGTSIRAIETTNKGVLWFAGSHGKFGRIFKETIQIDSIKKLNNKYLHFRSIAYNKDHIFILSIESPAILFQIDRINDCFKSKIVYQENHPKVFYDSMTFLDDRYGIAAGDPTENCLSVILTENGGNSWHKLSCKNLPEISIGEACFAASNTNIDTYKKHIWIVTGGKMARVFHSSNRGKTWKVYNTPIIQGGQMTGIYSVNFYDARNGIIMGGDWNHKKSFNATKAITHDGGKTWKLTSNNQLPGYISCVQYFPGSDKKILATSTEGIYLSKDNGNSWKRISERGFYTLRFENDHTVWLAGNNLISKLTFIN